MFIALEGIDGAGKTTAARSLCDRLRRDGVEARYVAKASVDCADPHADAAMTSLRALIWQPAGREPLRDLLGTHYYVCLNAAWYSAFDRCGPVRNGGHGLLCVDGWYYRAIVKAHLRSGIDFGWLETLFAHIRPPDAVVLLDIDPALAWRRGSTFKPTELGRWDGYGGEDRAAFCAYQGRVRMCLLDQARAKGWHVIAQADDLSIDDTVDRIRSLVLNPALSAMYDR